jgi:hypothetical protein
MRFTLTYLILLLLGWDPLAEKLRPYFEQQRWRDRHGTPKILSILSLALYLLSDPRWEQRARTGLTAPAYDALTRPSWLYRPNPT